MPWKIKTLQHQIYKPIVNQFFCETSFMCQGLHKDFNKIINIWSKHHMFKGHEDWYSQPILNHISMNQ
jgi:hypothetical protein